MKKRKIWIIGIIVVILAIFGIFSFHQKKNDTNVITLGSQGTDTQVWQYISKSNEAKSMGLKIKVQDFTDSAALNRALQSGQIDANAFQSYAYFLDFNKANGNELVALGTTYIQPMGIYSNTYKSINEIPNNSTIAIANDAAAESRGLKLLESSGLIALSKHKANELVTTKDVVKNPKNLKLKTIISTSAPSVLNDKSVAAVVIDNNTAQAAHLNVLKQSIYHEKVNQNTKLNVNIIAVDKKNKNNESLKKLVQLYHNKDIQKYINKKFPAKVEINKSINYLNN